MTLPFSSIMEKAKLPMNSCLSYSSFLYLVNNIFSEQICQVTPVHQSLLLVVRFNSDTTVDKLGDTWSIIWSCGWSSFFLGTTVTFIRFTSLFVAYVVSFLDALVLTFLVLTFVPRGSLLPPQVLRSRRFPLRVLDHICLGLIEILISSLLEFSVALLNLKPHSETFQL